MHEVETKILEVDPKEIKRKLLALGAKFVLDTKLVVDWYGPKNLTHRGDDPWYLRVRSYSDGKNEVTWKGISKQFKVARGHKEINFFVTDPGNMGEILKALEFEHYAHQEKYRQSWALENWRFDLDRYPGMPPYLEIEAQNQTEIVKAIAKLGLSGHKTSSEGERAVIEGVYKLDWFKMPFPENS
ncbi:MAG: CYTH domain-containing protein [Patescibacteria group bacterium]|nr:CYTH domain-containing protein [Patescibacteria group bacterium]